MRSVYNSFCFLNVEIDVFIYISYESILDLFDRFDIANDPHLCICSCQYILFFLV